MRIAVLLLALSVAGCAPAGTPEANDSVPIPSGPPMPQQKEALEGQPGPSAQTAPAPHWETVVTGAGMGLTWLEGGEPRFSIACLADRGGLVVQASGFKPVGSEDRFMLGLGSEPVTLVADLAQSGAAGGVVAEGPLPDGLDDLLRKAGEISLLYGTQRLGPVPAPSDELIDTFVKTCTGGRG